MSSHPSLVILSGASRSGKSTLCLHAVDRARRLGLTVAGVVTLPHSRCSGLTHIDACDLRTGRRSLLAHYVENSGDPIMEHWQFSDEGVRLGADALRQSVPCDVLIVDEIGPLELVYGRGWAVARQILRQQAYRLAIVSVRPLLIPNVLTWVEGVQPVTMSIDQDTREAARAQLTGWIEGLDRGNP